MYSKQHGFTLIELMISLTLGLIVVAAATLLLLTGQRSVAMQKGVAELQDNANFGLNYITKDIRLTNLNTRTAAINDQTPYGGVVLSSASTAQSNIRLTTALNATLLSNSDRESNVKDSSGDLKSDQIVIQFLPQYIIDNKGTASTADDVFVGGVDCEGNRLEFNVETQGAQYIVQRYFLRSDTNKASNETSPLALACDAGYYSMSGTPASITNYGDNGEIIMKRVDYFRVLLGIELTETDTSASAPVTTVGYRYVSIPTYMAMTAPRPRILSVQLGALVRSTQSVQDQAIKDDQRFTVLDNTVQLKSTATTPKYVRQVVSQTVAIRNALGERE